MRSIEILEEEHDNILRMLYVIHKAELGILCGEPLDIDDLKKMVDFIRKYADKNHHGKEEAYLFQVMEEELGKPGENLVRHGMLVEHDIARLYVSDLNAALDTHRLTESDESKLAVLVAAGSYEQLLRRHILKENEVVYPFGEKQLSKKSLEWVEEQMLGFEMLQENISEREYQLSVLADLEKKYI